MNRKGRTAFIFAYLAPAVLLYAVFVVWPLIQSVVISFTNWRGLSDQKDYVGLENYERLIKDEAYITAVKNNLWILVFGGLAILVVGLLMAHAVQGDGKLAKVLRATYLIPHVISLVVVAILWAFLYHPSFGLVTQGGEMVGIRQPEAGYLGDLDAALPAVTLAFVWYAVGFYIMLFAAGLKNIPSDISEAASLDGAAGLTRFWRVTWPLMWSVRKVAVTYIVITVINIFALVQVMTRGGNPDRRTEVMLSYFFEKGQEQGRYGQGAAIAVTNLALALGVALILMFVFRKNPEARR
ncbi:MAG: sugar ABC transporter permease [Fimbriimonadaceae bacterium]|nr:sugar ABC transporter permease [Fimbriimonadaceae bacterium]